MKISISLSEEVGTDPEYANANWLAGKTVPEFSKPCWAHAIIATLGISDRAVQALAKKHEWDGKSQGLSATNVIQMVWTLIGKMPDLTLTKEAKGFSAKEFSSKTAASGLVFTTKHVMPMVNGRIFNFNGHGDGKVVIVASYALKN